MSRNISFDQNRQIIELSMRLQLPVKDILEEAKTLGLIAPEFCVVRRRYKDLSFEEADKLLAWLIQMAETDPDLKAREAGAHEY